MFENLSRSNVRREREREREREFQAVGDLEFVLYDVMHFDLDVKRFTADTVRTVVKRLCLWFYRSVSRPAGRSVTCYCRLTD